MITKLRPLILALLAVLVQIGWLDPAASEFLAEQVELLLGGVFAVWAIIAWRRNRKQGVPE